MMLVNILMVGGTKMASNQTSPQGLKKELIYKNFAQKNASEQMRGLQDLESAGLMISAHQNYYNFIRIHQAIGKTPAEASNINIDLNNGNQWLKLLELSLKGGRNE